MALSWFEKCEVTKGNDEVVPCLTPAMWRERIADKEDSKDNEENAC